jgi:hypothetical protein
MTEWVCPECALDYGTLTLDRLPDAVRPFPARWHAALEAADDGPLRSRPAPGTWSPIEYAGHVGQVTGWLVDTLEAMVAGGELPTGEDPDQQVLREGYAGAGVGDVLAGIDAQTARLVAFLSTLTPEAAAREADFGWGTRDVLAMSRNAVHEQTHHLLDVTRILGSQGTGPGPA